MYRCCLRVVMRDRVRHSATLHAARIFSCQMMSSLCILMTVAFLFLNKISRKLFVLIMKITTKPITIHKSKQIILICGYTKISIPICVTPNGTRGGHISESISLIILFTGMISLVDSETFIYFLEIWTSDFRRNTAT